MTKKQKKRINPAGKAYLKQQGVSPVAAKYYNYFREICQEFMDNPKYAEFDSEDAEFSKKSKYFIYVKDVKDFENPFVHNGENLEKFVARKFGVNRKFDVTLIENRADAVEIVVSREFFEIIDGKKVPVFHGILLAVGNLGLSTDEKIDEEVRRTLF